VEFDVPDKLIAKVQYVVDSADPHTTLNHDHGASRGPMFYVDVHNEETDPNHPKFPEKLGRKMKLSKSRQESFVTMAQQAMQRLYPKISSQKILANHVELPTLGGHRLSNTTAKYATHLSSKTEIEVMSIYL
jgi:hypothetical protein